MNPVADAVTEQPAARASSVPGRLVVAAENHTRIGGLGEAVASLWLGSGVAPRFRQIARPDQFLAARALPTPHDRYGVSSSAVAERIKAWL